MNNNSINTRSAVQISTIANAALANDAEAIKEIAPTVNALKKEVLGYGWRLTDTEALCLLSSGWLNLVRRQKHPASHRHGGHYGAHRLEISSYDTMSISVVDGPTWWGWKLPKKYHKWLQVDRSGTM